MRNPQGKVEEFHRKKSDVQKVEEMKEEIGKILCGLGIHEWKNPTLSLAIHTPIDKRCVRCGKVRWKESSRIDRIREI